MPLRRAAPTAPALPEALPGVDVAGRHGHTAHPATGRGTLVGVTTQLAARHAAGQDVEATAAAVPAAVDPQLTGSRHERDDLAVLARRC